jgi:hypothetical protein
VAVAVLVSQLALWPMLLTERLFRRTVSCSAHVIHRCITEKLISLTPFSAVSADAGAVEVSHVRS